MNLTGGLPVAAVQMVSGHGLQDNLLSASRLVAQAADQGAKLVALPEYFCLMGLHDTDKLSAAESFYPRPLELTDSQQAEVPIQAALARWAKQHQIWLVGGSIPLVSSEPNKVLNTCLTFTPDGHVVHRYDKLHLFAFDNGKERYDEARSLVPGEHPVACTTAAGRTGLSVCYDLRFPEFFRSLSSPSPLDLIVLPAAFTYTTGQAHWDILLRARAIENQCWLVASAQGGQHSNGRATWGHSMVIDPWGQVVACCDQGEGLALAKVDPDLTQKVRLNLPALRHRQLALQPSH